MTDNTPNISITPNVVIEDPATRRSIGKTLYLIGLLVSLVALFIAFFPDAVPGDIENRAVAFLNAAILLVSAGFGLSVVTPNTPRA